MTTITDEQIEAGARALCQADGNDPDAVDYKDQPQWKQSCYTVPTNIILTAAASARPVPEAGEVAELIKILRDPITGSKTTAARYKAADLLQLSARVPEDAAHRFRQALIDNAYDDEPPEHDCEFATNPPKGSCAFHEAWAAFITAPTPEQEGEQ